MADHLPDYETIERAYDWTRNEILGNLPESTESRRALDHLKLAEDYTLIAREKAPRKEGTEA